jgi:IS4 transposase
MIFSQTAHSLRLNDISDTLRNHSGVLTTMRNAVPPSRNGLSYAKRNRNADMAEDLFWEVLASLQSLSPEFGMGRKYCGFPRRFKRIINVVDSTTISLVANCMDWAKHRRRKAAAKCHMRLDLQTFLPRFAVVKKASTSDATEARQVCADIQDGEIVIFDKAYVDFAHLFCLTGRGVSWVSRAKENMQYEVISEHTPTKGNILRDVLVKLTVDKSAKDYPDELRLSEAAVDIDGKEQTLTFLTNNMQWSPSSVCDLYKARWGIEVFFKQIKQTLQLADFLGYNENAVRWQVWIALLTCQTTIIN